MGPLPAIVELRIARVVVEECLDTAPSASKMMQTQAGGICPVCWDSAELDRGTGEAPTLMPAACALSVAFGSSAAAEAVLLLKVLRSAVSTPLKTAIPPPRASPKPASLSPSFLLAVAVFWSSCCG